MISFGQLPVDLSDRDISVLKWLIEEPFQISHPDGHLSSLTTTDSVLAQSTDNSLSFEIGPRFASFLLLSLYFCIRRTWKMSKSIMHITNVSYQHNPAKYWQRLFYVTSIYRENIQDSTGFIIHSWQDCYDLYFVHSQAIAIISGVKYATRTESGV